jgi:hypothetical protein
VGVNSSAPIWVTVGVKVSGVLVEVANRFWVGAGVMLAVGVGVSTAGTGVGVRSSCITSESGAQLESRRERTRREGYIFIENLLQLNSVGRSWIEHIAICKRDISP